MVGSIVVNILQTKQNGRRHIQTHFCEYNRVTLIQIQMDTARKVSVNCITTIENDLTKAIFSF